MHFKIEFNSRKLELTPKRLYFLPPANFAWRRCAAVVAGLEARFSLAAHPDSVSHVPGVGGFANSSRFRS